VLDKIAKEPKFETLIWSASSDANSVIYKVDFKGLLKKINCVQIVTSKPMLLQLSNRWP